MGIADRKLFWWRVMHWKFLVPLGLMIWAFVQFFLQAIFPTKYTAVSVSVPAGIILMMNLWIDSSAPIQRLSDERDLQETQKSNYPYSWGISTLAIFGTIWFSMKTYWPSIWTPTTGDEWRAIFWLLFCAGISGRLTSERLRAKMPLDEDRIDVNDSKTQPTNPHP